MTEEEYFRKTYPDSCYGDKPLSPYWDFFQDGVEFGERQSEKNIEELEKENAEFRSGCGMCYSKDKDMLVKAKDLIENIIRVTWGEGWNYSLDWKVKAEQFLNSENIILEDAKAGNSPFDADEVFNKEIKAYPEEK